MPQRGKLHWARDILQDDWELHEGGRSSDRAREKIPSPERPVARCGERDKMLTCMHRLRCGPQGKHTLTVIRLALWTTKWPTFVFSWPVQVQFSQQLN